MAGLSDWAELKILNHVYGNTAWAIPGTLYAALFTISPTDAGGGTEVVGGSYARVVVTNNVANFPNAASRAKSNANAVTFPTASADWGTVQAFAFFDAAVAGNMIAWQPLVAPVSVLNGNTFGLNTGQLNIVWPTTNPLTGGASNYLVHKILDLIFGGTTWAIPANFYHTSYRTDPTDTDAGTEETGGGYSRTAIANNVANFPNAVAGVKTWPGALITPTQPSANWGPITHGALRDANVAGNLYHYGPLPAAESFVSGDSVSLPASSMTITQD